MAIHKGHANWVRARGTRGGVSGYLVILIYMRTYQEQYQGDTKIILLTLVV